MPDLISHADMIVAVKLAIEHLKIDVDHGEPITKIAAALVIDNLRAVLAHLERTQPVAKPADLTERARALAIRIRARYKAPGNEHELELEDAAAEIVAFAQSEREAERAEARRATIEECARQVGCGRWMCSEGCEGPKRIRALASARQRCRMEQFGDGSCDCPQCKQMRALASPAPQEARDE